MHLQTGTRVLLCASTATMFVAMVIHCIAFSTHYWLVSSDPTSPFQCLGLHEVCFRHCRQPYCHTSGGIASEFNGCYRIHNENFRYVHEWLLPKWYLRCRLLSILLVPGTCLSFACLLTAACIACLYEYDLRVARSCRVVAVSLCVVVGNVLMFASFIIGVVLLATFHMMAFQDTWMPVPEINALGYSYWMQGGAVSLIAISLFFGMLAFVCKLQRDAKLSAEPAGRSYSTDMTIGG